MQSTSHPQPTPFRAVIDGGLIRVCDVMGHDFGGLSFRFEGARTQAIKAGSDGKIVVITLVTRQQLTWQQ